MSALPAKTPRPDAQPDAVSLAALYRELREPILRYLVRILCNRADAEDVLHEVFVKAYRALHRPGPAPLAIRSWLFAVARTSAIDHRRRHAHEDPFEPEAIVKLEEAQSPAVPVVPALWISDPEIVEALRRLPPRQQEVIVLRYVIGCSHAQVARVLGSSEAAVTQAHRRGLRTLADALPSPEHRGRRFTHPMARQRLPRHVRIAGFTLMAPQRRLA